MRDVDGGDEMLEGRPPLVLGSSPSAPMQPPDGGRRSLLDRFLVFDHLFRTPLHREILVSLVLAAIVLVGVATVRERARDGDSVAPGIASEMIEGGETDDGRSTGFFRNLFGVDDADDNSDEDEETLVASVPPAGDVRDSDDPDGGEKASETDGSESATPTSVTSTSVTSESATSTSVTSTSAPSTGSSSTSTVQPATTAGTVPATVSSTATVLSWTTRPSTSRPSTITQPSTSRPPTTATTIGQPIQPEPDPAPAGAGPPFRKHSLPGTIQAEHFDSDGQGKAYNDLDVENVGAALRKQQSVDIDVTDEGDYYVRKTRTSEWLEYTVQVPEAGSYRATVKVSSTNQDPGELAVQIDGVRFARFDVGHTGGNATWVELVSEPGEIKAGTHVVRLAILNGGKFNIDLFRIEPN